MKIAMGNDHTAVELKNIIKKFVVKRATRFWIWEPTLLRAAIIRYTAKRWEEQSPPKRQIWELLSVAPAWESPWQPIK